MEHKQVDFDARGWSAARKKAQKLGKTAQALLDLGEHSYDGAAWNTLYDALARPLLQKPEDFQSLEQFYTPELSKLLRELTDKDYEARIPALLMLRAEGQFSDSYLRRSYHSASLHVYLPVWIRLLAGLVRGYYFSGSLYDKLFTGQESLIGYEYQLALALRQGDERLSAALREAIYGDSSKIKLSRKGIEAIVISGREDLLEDLMQLLLTAGLQEGLRQQILESADKGSAQTLARILKCCLDHELFRYSSAIRALDVWTGLPTDDARPARARRSGELAYAALTDAEKRKEFLQSEDLLQVYFALWGQACRELDETRAQVETLLRDEKPSRRVLGWYFVRSTDMAAYCMTLACRHLDERDEEVLAWLTGCLVRSYQLVRISYEQYKSKSFPNPNLPREREERRRVFAALKELAAFIGNKKRRFSDLPFPGNTAALSNEPVISCMMSLAAYEMDDTLTRQLPELCPWMSADQKLTLIRSFLHPASSLADREVLRSLLSDRSVEVKEQAVKALSSTALSAEELRELADALRSKSSSLRGAILSALRSQPRELLLPLIAELLQSSEETRNQAAIELLLEQKDADPALPERYRSELDALRQRKLSTQTTILLDQLLPRKTEEVYTRENGFGLYDPAKLRAYRQELDERLAVEKPGLLQKLLGKTDGDCMSEQEIRGLFPSKKELERILERLNAVFVRHADYEYCFELSSGERQKRLFGDLADYYWMPLPAGCGFHDLRQEGASLRLLPFCEEFQEALGDYGKDPGKALALYALSNPFYISRYDDHNAIAPWFAPLQAKQLVPNYWNDVKTERKPLLQNILRALPGEFDVHTVFPLALKLYRSTIQLIGEQRLGESYVLRKGKDSPNIMAYLHSINSPMTAINHRYLAFWRGLIHSLPLSDADFALWFPLEYRYEQLGGAFVSNALSVEDLFRAHSLGLIGQDVLIEWLLDPTRDLRYKMTVLSDPRSYPGRQFHARFPRAAELVRPMLDRIVSVEEKRGELPTELTLHCIELMRVEGAGHFCRLLAALGRENFYRGYEYSWATDKRSVLSRLLKRCYPAKDDTPELLRELLKATDISDKRLAEAVMYAPQWAGLAEQVLNWPGLKSAVWFFHAHINENFSAEKETEVALYSPISPQRFNDGAFDKGWFLDAYGKLGEKRFQILYKSAKYITAGSSLHRRSQLYSDAVLGRLDEETLRQEIREKRNQEKLRCYPLLPMDPGDSREALRRWTFIQQFLKESRQFGAQRRESEKKACSVALENLAITTGYDDVDRMTWQMETAKTEELRPLMEPVEAEGYRIALRINEKGEASVDVRKDGKLLKTLPKALAKNESYLRLKESEKKLKEQQRRARESLERAMTEQTDFLAGELQNLLQNPVLAPMVEKLLWCSEGRIGFPVPGEQGLLLRDVSGLSSPCGERLRPAHPHDLNCAGIWADWMHLLFDQKIVQPFKQVFREYYPITADERQERTVSRRYAGYQVQPRRTLALLKGRGWTVDYEEGLQKVFYKEDLVVRMFALADWFSPADIEAPTLETVEFFSRSTGKNVALEDVPSVLFSETMRDLDLVVSVAYVGGVDPEASHSTVELRLALAEELLRLLHVSNVSFVGSHARIEGKLASWSVHMGSGVVHAQGKGSVVILPVHSQARGRIFLPFADDDPKTAEILSKILLLSEDSKIKDPGILSQI